MNEEIETVAPWVRLEIVSATIGGYFREDSKNDLMLVTTISDMPCIVLELVSANDNRTAVGIALSTPLAEIRESAIGLAESFGVPLVDCTLPAARRAQI
jgi:hypothetical protein